MKTKIGNTFELSGIKKYIYGAVTSCVYPQTIYFLWVYKNHSLGSKTGTTNYPKLCFKNLLLSLYCTGWRANIYTVKKEL